jgi:cytochrome b
MNTASTSTATHGSSTPHCTATTARRWVTDAPTRMFHALFALSFALAWVTGDSEHWRALHVTLGYTMVGLLAFRIVYGFVGPRPARWSSLARRLAGAPTWWRATTAGLRQGNVPWRQGQSLLMAAVVAALLLFVVPLAASGYATYADWGGEWLAEVHEAFANAMLLLVLLHLGLMGLLSALRRQNQTLPMLTGRVSGSGPDLVSSQRHWLAGLLLVAALGFGAWQWNESPNGLLASASSGGAASARERDED